jgi:rhodanese-related sulfurtransferase
MTPTMAQFTEFFQHHLALFAILGGAIALFIANEVHGQLSGAARIGPLDAVRLINDRNALIVDVRPAADFKKGHLMNALNLPLARLDEQLGELGKDKARPILVYCALGNSSNEAARKLMQHGFTDVHSLRGGIDGWLASNLPTTVK